MRLILTCLLVIAASASLNAEDDALPENFFDRIDAIIKWFEIRISVYRKANTLLKQLTRKVDALPSFHNGVNIYYQRWVNPEQNGLKSHLDITLARTPTGNDTRIRASELLKDMLKEQEVKHVLTMMPEVRDTFKKMVSL